VFAYLDAGTASVIMAAVAGGLAGVAVLFKMYYHKFLGIFSKKHRRTAEQAEADLLGVEIDPETGEPIESDPTGRPQDDTSTIGDRS
jgi:hypothetical protein